MNLQLLSVLLSLLHLGLTQSQTENFVVNIVEYTPPNQADAKFRCLATVIHSRFLLTTAYCANVHGFSEIAIETGIFVTDPNSTNSLMEIKNIFIHEEYDDSKNRFNNIAILETEHDFNTTMMPPRKLGTLRTNSTCELFAWGTSTRNPTRNIVSIFNSTFCDPNFDQIFCTTFDSRSDNTCSAYQGSPLVCGDGFIDGFLISDQACTITDNRYMVYYHSVGEFEEWIKDITGAGIKIQTSILLILSAMLITSKCFI